MFYLEYLGIEEVVRLSFWIKKSIKGTEDSFTFSSLLRDRKVDFNRSNVVTELLSW